MALTLEQYASYLDSRDLPWPAPPKAEPVRAKAHLRRLSGIRAVLWNVYGTLLAIPGGELWFEHPQPFVMKVALDKVVQEFKMWQAMPRKAVAPGEYLGELYRRELLGQRSFPPKGERHPEVASDRVWAEVVKKLMPKDYRWDASVYGSLNEFGQKLAYFFHASLQGTAGYPGAAEALGLVKRAGLAQGLLADGQCFTPLQLQRGLSAQDPDVRLDDLLGEGPRVLSYQVWARKPSPTPFRKALRALGEQGIEPGEVLYVGSSLPRDVAPARRARMQTALFAGDRASLQATPAEMKAAAGRPDVLLPELSQLAEVIT
jgi:FMN phosphatase YigB (HAD superfamily)